jgi:hypothetical protein
LEKKYTLPTYQVGACAQFTKIKSMPERIILSQLFMCFLHPLAALERAHIYMSVTLFLPCPEMSQAALFCSNMSKTARNAHSLSADCVFHKRAATNNNASPDNKDE